MEHYRTCNNKELNDVIPESIENGPDEVKRVT
jgi:hypothetical protein